MWILDLGERVRRAFFSAYEQIKNNLSKYLRVGFLIFCVLSSKNILIYNEEFLVALTFVLFLDFSFYYFSGTVKDSLDERSNNIQIELQGACVQKREICQYNAAEYDKTDRACSMISECRDLTISVLDDSKARPLNHKFGNQRGNKSSLSTESKLFSESKRFLYSKVRNNIQLCCGVHTRAQSRQVAGNDEMLITNLALHFKSCALLGLQKQLEKAMPIQITSNTQSRLGFKQVVAGLSTLSLGKTKETFAHKSDSFLKTKTNRSENIHSKTKKLGKKSPAFVISSPKKTVNPESTSLTKNKKTTESESLKQKKGIKKQSRSEALKKAKS